MRLALSFGTPPDPASARDPGRYTLTAAGPDRRLGTRDDRAIALRRVAYDPAARVVTLTPRRRLPPCGRLLLVADGSSSAALADGAGNRLDGDGDGRPGGDYRRAFRLRELLSVGPRVRSGPAPGVSRRQGGE